MMNDLKKENRLETINIKAAGLWTALMFMYVYSDLFSFYRTGYLVEVMNGYIGFLKADQKTLLLSGLLMLIPILMIIVNLYLDTVLGRWINLTAGIIYTAVGIGNLVGET